MLTSLFRHCYQHMIKQITFRLTTWFLFPPFQPLPPADSEACQVQTCGRTGRPAAGGWLSITVDTAGILWCRPLRQSAQHKPKHIIATAGLNRTWACYCKSCVKGKMTSICSSNNWCKEEKGLIKARAGVQRKKDLCVQYQQLSRRKST